MKKILFFVLITITPFYLHAKAPIADKSEFERQILECFQKEDVRKCLPPFMKRNYMRDVTDEDVNQITNTFTTWLRNDHVYAIHKAKTTKIAEFYDERIYVIEDTSGSAMVMILGFRNRNGAWYLSRIGLNSQENEVGKILGLTP